MENINLPLWNSEETDVRPEYQLTFGHMLCKVRVEERSLDLLASMLGLGTMRYSGSLDNQLLPHDHTGEYRNLGTLEYANLLAVRQDECDVVFAPHMLYFNNQAWMNWNGTMRGLMTIATRADVKDMAYDAFQNGRIRKTAWWDGEALTFPEEPKIDLYLNRELIYRSPDSTPVDVRPIISLLRSDVELQDEAGSLLFRERFSGRSIPTSCVRHVLFQR